jgi:polysaccharide export outer membrane protein
MPANVFSLKLTRGSLRSLLSVPLCLGFALASTSCASAGQYVWFGEMPQTERAVIIGDYVIGVGDTINIRVYEQDSLSGDAKIRSDGKIAIPLVGEVMVAGKRPLELSQELETAFKQFVVTPRVTVNVTAPQPISVTVVGEVTRIGVLTLEPPARLVEAMAQSGGVGEFGDKDKIFVLRQFPSYKRIRFTWEAIIRNEDNAGQFPLRTGDVIVVE